MSELTITFVFNFISAMSGFILGVYLGKKNLEEAAEKATKELKDEDK